MDIDGNGTHRTGDYVGAQADPADELGFRIAGEFVGELGGTGSCEWKTRFTRVAY